MKGDVGPTARALLGLELLQDVPGITAGGCWLRVVRCPELQQAARLIGQRLIDASQ